MSITEELTNAIAMHGLWKSRIRRALTERNQEIPAETARRDDACQFGIWLQSNQTLAQYPRYRKVQELHRRFHIEVGRVLDMALAGNPHAAGELEAGSALMALSSSLTREMIDWRDELK